MDQPFTRKSSSCATKRPVAHREAKTFDRRQAAAAWLKRREEELSKPDAIDRYTAESRKKIGRTKAQVLAAIKGYDIADRPCVDIRS
jgi:hypothetical protein